MKRLSALAILALGLISPAANALTAGSGDVILGFRATAGTGNDKNLVVKLGQASQFTGASGTLSVTDIAADLAATYGSNWASRTDLFWGVIGATSSFAAVGGDPAGTTYASRVRPSAATAATAWTAYTTSTQSFITNKVNTARNGVAAGAAGINTSAAIEPTSGTSCWSALQPGGALANGISFAAYDPTIEGTPVRSLDFFKMTPQASTEVAGSNLGTFTLSANGKVSFVTAATAAADLASGGTIAVSNPAINVVAGATTATVTVTRTGGLAASSVVVNTVAGSATSPADFTAISAQTVSFAYGETTASVNVPVTLSGALIASSKSFTVVISGASSGATLGTDTATITIPAAVGGTITVSTPIVQVSSGATTATVTLTRSGGSDPATVVFNTTADSATSPANFTAISNQTVSFGSGINTANVSITLSGAVVTAVKSFSAAISAPSAGTTLGAVTTASIRLRTATPDTTNPVLTIVKPALNASVNEVTGTGTVEISGALTETNPGTVVVSVNGGAPITALTTITTTAKTWKLLATQAVGQFTPGTNNIVVTATDLDGNQGSASTHFTYVVKRPLSITNPTTNYTITPALSAGNAVVGATYTITAKPSVGFFFDSWSGTGGTVFTSASTITTSFVFAIGNTVTANFTASPFTSTVAGIYNGIVKGSTTGTDTQGNAGLFTATVVLNTGAFTGKLDLDGVSAPIAGVFNNVSKTFATPTVANGSVYSLLLDIPNAKITGTITQRKRGADVAVITVNAPQGNITATGGPFVVAFSAPATPADLNTDEYPHGNGYETIKFGLKGVATTAGTLADGTVYTSAATATTTNVVPVFASFASRTGSLVGNATIATPAVTGTGFRWFKSASASQYYPYGYANGGTTGLTVDIAAGNSTAGTNLPATVSFTGGEFESLAQSGITVGATSSATAAKMVLTAGVNKGEWAGNTTHPGKHIIGGVNVNGVNYGYILSPLPTQTDGTGQGSLVVFP